MRVSLPATFVVMMLMTGFVRPAAATPISYSESGSGDLSTFLPAPTVFTLDVGVNTVSGMFGLTTADFSDRDSFAFSVPAGMVVTGVSYAFTRTTVGNANAGNAHFFLDDGNILPAAPNLGSQNVDLFGASPLVMFNLALPLSAGTYGISNDSLLAGAPSGGTFGWTADYTWSLTVAPTATSAVPEPASLLLLGGGLIGAGAFRRWRTRRKAA